jgi:hypothetical protein
VSAVLDPGTVRHLARLEQEAREQQAAEALLRKLFAAAVHDVQQPALFAWRPAGRVRPVHEVMVDTIQGSPLEVRAMQILANAAAGRASQRDAQQLLDDMAAKFARSEADLV